MCGIAGIIGEFASPDQSRGLVERMNRMQKHRGPDGQGLAQFEGATLGHVRLSIIDLSDRAQQPMMSRDNRFAIVFNGEIYNYRELRQELAGRYSFGSDSDTEVLLGAYVVWGEDCLSKINGMFAFCIYDLTERTAFFARDRFGQKPLYYVDTGKALLFASEVKPLLACGIAARPNLSIWARYLLIGAYDDTEDNYFDGIDQLQPSECMRYSPGKGCKRSYYYDVTIDPAAARWSLDQAADALRGTMIDACQIHMRSDVPVGIMLSGGLDSSTMLAALDQGGALNEAVKCYSVEFGDGLTERPWIEAAAGYHHLPSRIDDFSRQDFLDAMQAMVWHLEGPVGGLMNSALSAVMAASKQESCKVLLDGTGPDEAFGGYRNHHNLYLAQLLKFGGTKADRAVSEYASMWGVSADAARQAAENELSRVRTSIDGTVPVRPDLVNTSAFPPAAQARPMGDLGDPLKNGLLEYVRGSKIPRNNRMLDRLSMAYGIELRLPFLDHRLIELGLSLPGDYYFFEGRTKGVIRHAFRGIMDDDVRLATKRSIQAPQGPWLRQEPMRQYVQDLISSDSFASRGLFDVKKVRAAFDLFCQGTFDNSFFVWQWINVEEWFRQFIDGNPVETPHPLSP